MQKNQGHQDKEVFVASTESKKKGQKYEYYSVRIGFIVEVLGIHL